MIPLRWYIYTNSVDGFQLITHNINTKRVRKFSFERIPEIISKETDAIEKKEGSEDAKKICSQILRKL
jgi:hypothetical protein